MSFGKNRVQYHRHFDEWVVYESPNFVTYWYGDARNIAQSAIQIAELDYPEIQQLLEHQSNNKIEILVFSDLTDLKQSNIGEDDLFQIRAGETKVVGNKIFVYFDGNHQHLRAQLREGMAAVLINSMLFGSNLQEIVQNAVLLNLPGWYTNGLSAYCGREWDSQLDDSLRDITRNNRYRTFDKFAKEHPQLAGHAFWYYISLHFGKGTVSNLLYLTRINRSMDAGFLYVLGGGYRRTTEALMEYFDKRYSDEAKAMREPEATAQIAIKNKQNIPLTQLRISPDGRSIAWASNHLGRWKVYVQDLQTNKRRRLMRGGGRNPLQTTDFNYPILTWHPDNNRLAILYERRDVIRLSVMDVKSRKEESQDVSPEYQRIYSADYLNGNDMVFSASSRGHSDLFIYRTITRQTERITQDFWDDLDVSVGIVDGKRGLLFVSNRETDTLAVERLDTIMPIGQFDVFFYDLDTRSSELIRLTQTPLADEKRPLALDSTYFTYLSDETGIYNRQGGYLEPYTAYYQTVFYLKDGAEVRSLDLRQRGEWPPERALALLAPADTVRKNLDSTQIDSIRTFPIVKKRAITWNQSNYSRNLADQDVSIRNGQLVEALVQNNRVTFYRMPYKAGQPLSFERAKLTRHQELMHRATGFPLPLSSAPGGGPARYPTAIDSISLTDPLTDNKKTDTIPTGWLFHVPDYLLAPGPIASKPSPDRIEQVATEELPQDFIPDSLRIAPMHPNKLLYPIQQSNTHRIAARFNQAQIIPYRLHFRTDYLSTSMNNDLLFDGLEIYNDSLSRFRTPPAGILLRANFKDMLENHIVEAGFRLPTTFNGTEFYLWYADKKRRLDRRFALYRRTQLANAPRADNAPTVNPPNQIRTNTFLGQYELRYPFDVFTSLRATFSLRQDRTISLSTDEITLDSADRLEQRAMVRLAFVYDNTVDIDMNIRRGTRARVYTDVVKGFAFNTQPEWSFNLNNGFMTVIGLDARHYQMVLRHSVVALRLAGATSFGSEKMLYILGGVENWLFPLYNENIPQPGSGDFVYRTLATNLRGFKQNIRNGNSYAVFNSELRVPIFKYFSRKPVMGNFWRNFQLIGFFDLGTAWQGNNPYDADNPINVRYFETQPAPPAVRVKVNYFRDPLVAGYGIGARSVLFGMLYLRADYAWGIETRRIQKPILHLALGTDF